MEIGDRETVEGRWRRADRSTFHAEHTIRKAERDGEVLFVMATRDITERKRRDEELERRVRAMEKAPIGISMSDPGREDNPLVYVNEEFTELTGYPAEEIVGQNCRLLQGDDTDPETVARMREAIDAREPVTAELRNYRRDGTAFWNRVTIAPITGDDGEVTNFVGFQEDVTERRTKEAKLAETREFLDDVIEAVPHPLYVLDVEDYSIRHANSRATVQEGQTCYEVTHNRDQPCHEGDDETFPCPLRDVVETGEQTTVEHTHYDDDGNEEIHEVYAAPLFEDDTVVGIVESQVDVTDRVEYEQRLKEQRDNLDMLNQVLRHDIRNDLQLVVAYAEQLAANVDDDLREYAETVLESADHAVELTTTARDMADVMLTDDDECQEPVSLRTTLESELDEVRASYSDAVVTVDGTVPAVRVAASEMLDSVFRNLLKNAIQHNDKEIAEVTVSAAVEDERVVVRIADNGPGVPDDQKSDIFGQGETGLDSTGTGIGLYLVESLVDRYGGDVWVEDNEPTGAVFVVELPKSD
jgi:PAS domain S-box-containing protein